MFSIKYSREDRLYTVCIDGDNGRGSKFVSLRDFDSVDAAACFINWLNGGNGDPFVERVQSR